MFEKIIIGIIVAFALFYAVRRLRPKDGGCGCGTDSCDKN